MLLVSPVQSFINNRVVPLASWGPFVIHRYEEWYANATDDFAKTQLFYRDSRKGDAPPTQQHVRLEFAKDAKTFNAESIHKRFPRRIQSIETAKLFLIAQFHLPSSPMADGIDLQTRRCLRSALSK